MSIFVDCDLLNVSHKSHVSTFLNHILTRKRYGRISEKQTHNLVILSKMIINLNLSFISKIKRIVFEFSPWRRIWIPERSWTWMSQNWMWIVVGLNHYHPGDRVCVRMCVCVSRCVCACVWVTQGAPPHRSGAGAGVERRGGWTWSAARSDPDPGVECRGGQSHPAGLHHDGLLGAHVLCGRHHCGQTLY